MKKEEVNKQIKEVVRPNGKGEINGNNLQETLLLMNNNAANDEDTTSKLNLKANQEETDEKLALKADKTSVYTKEEANALLDLKVNIKDYETDKEVSSKEKQELDIKLAQTKQELDSVKNSLSHMGNGVVGEAKGGSVINLPENAMKSVVPNYKIEGLTDVEGAKSVQLPMRVKSVGENLFNPNVNIINKNVYSEEFFDGSRCVRYIAAASVTNKPFCNLNLPAGEYIIKVRWFQNVKIGAGLFIYYEDGTTSEGARRYSSDDAGWVISVGKTNSKKIIGLGGSHNASQPIWIDLNSLYVGISDEASKYQESLAYFNDEVELNSVGEVKDYIENGILYKNISDDGEILKKTEVVNLSTSGLIEANPNGTVFFEPITNITGFYDNGLDVEGLDILEVEEFSHLINGVYQSLDVSKVKVEGGKLTHPDAQNGIVYLVYRYDNNPVWGENTISYYNSDKTLKSPNGKIWKKVESATDTGELLVTLEEVKEEIVEPIKEEE